jgi:membrane fusion protein, heavy metal efflux system
MTQQLTQKSTPKLTPRFAPLSVTRSIARSAARSTAVPLVAASLLFALSACKSADQGNGAPPPAQVVEVPDMNLITISPTDVPKFPLATVGQIQAPSLLSVTGSVFPDIAREVPVISLANGRVVDIKTRLDDNVKKGQLLFSVQSPDISTAFDTYLKAVNDEQLANTAFLRTKDLYDHGAVSQAMLQQAEAAEKDAHADLAAAEEQLKLYGVDKDHPSPIVNVYAPVSGVIIAQNITNAAAAGVTLSGSATAFTIADLSSVWILCDVYENDLPKVRVGQQAQIKVDAYPDHPLTGRISDIGPVLDPSIRTAKVRVEVANPGFLKLGMFATATFTSIQKQSFAVVPADAVLHLHDRDWVYVPAGGNHFRRVEVRAGDMVAGNREQILPIPGQSSTIAPGDKVVTNALLLDAAGNQ